jgi:hypothetical protein
MSTNLLEDIFPQKSIPVAGGKDIKLVPISLGSLSKVIQIITPIFKGETDNLPLPELADTILAHIMEILPLCTETPPDKIPFSVIPDVVEAIIELNFPEEALKKWKALAEKIQKLGLLAQRGTVKESGKNTATKSIAS